MGPKKYVMDSGRRIPQLERPKKLVENRVRLQGAGFWLSIDDSRVLPRLCHHLDDDAHSFNSCTYNGTDSTDRTTDISTEELLCRQLGRHRSVVEGIPVCLAPHADGVFVQLPFLPVYCGNRVLESKHCLKERNQYLLRQRE